MDVIDRQRMLLELCAIRTGAVSVDWTLIARQAQDPGLEDLHAAIITEQSAAATKSLQPLREGLRDRAALTKRVTAELDAAGAAWSRYSRMPTRPTCG